MKAKIIDIGNSKGIRLKKVLLDQLGIGDEVSLEILHNGLLIKALTGPRFNWAQSFKAMAEKQDDQLLDAAPPSDWDSQEWEWK